MQDAIPYRTWHQTTTLTNQNNPNSIMGIRVINDGKMDHDDDALKRMVEENAVIVFARKGCCLSHVVKCLLHGLGANPAVYEVEDKDLNGVVLQLEEKVLVGTTIGCGGGGGKEGRRLQFPAVFIGGRWFGGLDRIMASHITGELTPLLKQAGALWL